MQTQDGQEILIQENPNQTQQVNLSRNIVISSHHHQQMLQVLNDNNNGPGSSQVIKYELVPQDQRSSSIEWGQVMLRITKRDGTEEMRKVIILKQP